MNDSTNVRIIADNIKKLEKMVKEAGSELPTPGAGDTGKILKVGSDGYELAPEYSYTPPAYSETETNTGKKWIDGKDVFCKVYSGTTPTENTPIVIEFNFDTLISVGGIFSNEYGLFYDFNKYLTWSGTALKSGIVVAYSSAYSGRPFNLIIYYTKPTPTPEPTTSTKKTTKKG